MSFIHEEADCEESDSDEDLLLVGSPIVGMRDATEMLPSIPEQAELNRR